MSAATKNVEQNEEAAAKERSLNDQYVSLTNKVEFAREDFGFWEGVVSDHRFAQAMKEFRDEIDACKEALVDADKADEMRAHQADVRARRRLLATLSIEARRKPLKEAEEALRKFESDHALFIQKQRKGK